MKTNEGLPVDHRALVGVGHGHWKPLRDGGGANFENVIGAGDFKLLDRACCDWPIAELRRVLLHRRADLVGREHAGAPGLPIGGFEKGLECRLWTGCAGGGGGTGAGNSFTGPGRAGDGSGKEVEAAGAVKGGLELVGRWALPIKSRRRRTRASRPAKGGRKWDSWRSLAEIPPVLPEPPPDFPQVRRRRDRRAEQGPEQGSERDRSRDRSRQAGRKLAGGVRADDFLPAFRAGALEAAAVAGTVSVAPQAGQSKRTGDGGLGLELTPTG